MALTVTVFVAQALSVWTLVGWFPALQPVQPMLEFVVDVGVVLPALVVLYVLPSARNIRQRQAAETALRSAQEHLVARVRERTAELTESNRKFREEAEGRQHAQKAVEFQAGLLDVVEQAVTATDCGGRILYWNRWAQSLYGWTPSEIKGRTLGDVVTYFQPDGGRLDVLEQCRSGASWSGEVEAVRRDGARVPSYLTCSPLPGESQGYVCISFDITEWKIAQGALRESEEKYSILVENSPTGVFIFQNDRFLFVNPKFAELLEYPGDELLQAEPWQVVHSDDYERVRAMARTSADGEPVPDGYECRLVTKTGQVRWVALRNTLIPFRGGTATLGNVQDVTDRKRMEAQLRQLSARLLTIQEEERRRVARDLHDSLGQKLTGIKFLVEASLGKPWPGERRSAIGQLRALIPTIQDVVEEVRRISTELRPSILDDLGLLPTMAWHLREFEKAHPGVAVEQRLSAAESDVPDALRTPIFRILQEATNNVAKHSGASRMLVGLDTGDGKLRLWVQDNGAGFDPGAPPREAGSGGIGMGSMRERAEISGGSFSVSSAPGTGTTVHAEWPLEPPVSL